jgi:hypothetical protein
MTENTSPLAEADASSLQELFDKDPLLLTDSDIEKIVTELRAQRGRWVLAEKKGKKKEAPKNISLADLDLDLS